ncbi:hypothetical protein ABFX02_08G026300 [Erythranthe guttata]
MGCVSSKKQRSQSPDFDDHERVVVSSSAFPGRAANRSTTRSASSGPVHVHAASGPLTKKVKEDPDIEAVVVVDDESGKIKIPDFDDADGSGNFTAALTRGPSQKKKAAAPAPAAGFTINFGRLSEGAEQAAAGWPAWLTSVAADAVDGWVPLSSDTYERLDKIGQGTYSNVYRARDLRTGKMVAVKKVRFDNFQPESVRFMAREIMILRRLDHPNIMKLEGIITSRLSCSIYLVFEYMEHDLAGLLSCPDIKFTDSQIKCYMRQLLSGVEHCHSRGIMHRDIKSSNILVNNEGVLKIADFGLANFLRPANKQPALTSRVVTLWYRPPELLLGSTEYGETVDLWSVGCVFAELFVGRPLLKGRTEVEQLHKIFKLCGSPQDDYWKKSRLPLATMFKPQQPYESTLRERCKEFPKSAVGLVETFLSVEPCRRGTASSALVSEYFSTKPYACDPSSLPKYPPNKEIDAKIREDARRKKSSAIARPEAGLRKPRRVRKPSQESNEFCKVIPPEEVEGNLRRANGGSANIYRRSRAGIEPPRASLKQTYDTKSEVSQMSHDSQESSTRSVPLEVTASSSSFAWAKRQKHQDVFTRLHSQPISRNQKSNTSDPSNTSSNNDQSDGQDQANESSGRNYRAMRREHAQLQRPESFDSSEIYEPNELSEDYGNKKISRVAFSGPLIYQSSQEIASRQYNLPHQTLRRSRFHKD